ncbi:MAG: hypothetical protein E7053_10825 [Lentisphaerae bacterium]|nr:hypothetical protein [Lentisphaerota bacterium]
MDRVVEFLKKHANATAAVCLFMVTLLFYLPGLSFETIPLDNSAYVGKEYLLYPTWQNFIYHLKTPVLNLYSPLVMHSLMLDYWLWGGELFHQGGILHNIILHGLNTVLFFSLLRQLKLVRLDPEKPFTLSLYASCFGALCFALHPQRIESVLWIVERKDVQMLFCGLLAVQIFLWAWRRNSLLLSVAGAVVYLFSFGAKPTLITLPAVLIFGIWIGTEKFDWKKSLKFTAPYWVAAAAYFIFNLTQVGEFAAGSAGGLFSGARLWIVAVNYACYFFKTLIPAGIQPLYPVFPVSGWNILLVICFWAWAVSCVVLAVVKWKYRRLFLSFIAPVMLVFLGVVLPMAGLRSIGNAEFADRYSYLAALPVIILLASACEFYSPRRTIWQFGFWAYAGLIAILGYCYMQTWQSRESFINAALGDGKNIHPAALRMAAWHCFENKDFVASANFARYAVENATPDALGEAEVYCLALEGMIALEQNDATGLLMIDQAISTPDWGKLRYSNPGFSELVLLKSAELHEALWRFRHNPADLEFTVQIYMVLSELTLGSDPAKKYSYQAYAAYLQQDYRRAEELTLQALEYAPGDENLLNNLQTFRELLKNPPEAAASN